MADARTDRLSAAVRRFGGRAPGNLGEGLAPLHRHQRAAIDETPGDCVGCGAPADQASRGRTGPGLVAIQITCRAPPPAPLARTGTSSTAKPALRRRWVNFGFRAADQTASTPPGRSAKRAAASPVVS